ncbi:hypothetical protein [Kitasatospora sp. NPDC057198]|uniref:hypothetical protein n=1 Tax=Kitasatospora sp. NPDC057198 TaxID=3346046 RepID=UPI00362F970B
MTDTEDDYAAYAPSGSLLGAVQRGRGLGFLLAREDRGAGAGAVLDCLRRETRWDRQADQRHGYHAWLLRELAVPVEPLVELLEGPDEDAAERAVQVLAEVAPLLRAFWRHTAHSCERPSYLRALHAIDLGAAAPLLHESLWDCEPDARLYAVRHAPDSPELSLRLAELRDSPVEDDELREAAAGRLG